MIRKGTISLSAHDRLIRAAQVDGLEIEVEAISYVVDAVRGD